MTGYRLDTLNPINWENELNLGLVSEWAVVNPYMGGNLVDLCMKNHGTLTNGPTWSGLAPPGGYGSLSFDGSNDLVNCGTNTNLNLLSTMTIICWFRPSTVGVGTQTLVSHTTGGSSSAAYMLEVNRTAGKMSIAWGGGSMLTSNTALSASTWYCGAMTRGDNGAGHYLTTLYLNGNADGSADVTAAAPTSTNTTSLGARDEGSTPFSGQIGLVSIYNRVLSSAEIFTRFNDDIRGNPERWNWISTRKYFFGGAAAPATNQFNAGWARNSNNLIGGGIY